MLFILPLREMKIDGYANQRKNKSVLNHLIFALCELSIGLNISYLTRVIAEIV